MIVQDYFRLSHPDAPLAANYGSLARVEQWRDRDPLGRGPDTYAIDRFPCCECCGDALIIASWADAPPAGTWRCAKHQGRNPCAIEGCKRTMGAPDGRLANDQWLCGTHWRAYVPPRSAVRRAYHRFFRLAKRHGWDDRLHRRFWRFWDALITRAKRQASEGHIDPAAINAMFGWAEE